MIQKILLSSTKLYAIGIAKFQELYLSNEILNVPLNVVVTICQLVCQQILLESNSLLNRDFRRYCIEILFFFLVLTKDEEVYCRSLLVLSR